MRRDSINSDASKAAANETVPAIKSASHEAYATHAHLRSVAEIEELFDKARSRFGRLEIAVNTVGKVLKKPIAETTEAEFAETFDINANTAFYFIPEAGGQLATIRTTRGWTPWARASSVER